MSSKQFFYRAIKIIFDGKGLNDIDFRLKDFQDYWLIILTFLCWFVCLIRDSAKRKLGTIYIYYHDFGTQYSSFLLIPCMDDFRG